MALILLAALAPLLAGQVVDVSFRSAGALVSGLGVAWGFYRAGWLGGHSSIHRMIWSGDGVWLLALRDGRQCEGRLRSDTRMSPAAIWLRWTIEPAPLVDAPMAGTARSRTLLLVPGDLPAGDFRRLLVRLRVDRSECAPTAQQTDPTLSS